MERGVGEREMERGVGEREMERGVGEREMELGGSEWKGSESILSEEFSPLGQGIELQLSS